MFLEDQIRQWQQQVLSEYCKSCSDNCCNAKKHRIILDDSSLPLFQEKGIPMIPIQDLDKSSFRNNQLRLATGDYIQKPALVQMPKFGRTGTEWYMYASSCPFYNNNQCEVHEDPRRPYVCRVYPIVVLGNDNPEGMLDVRVMDSCECFRNRKIKSKFEKKFPVRIIRT